MEQSLIFRVEGDLDAEETAAIRDLVRRAEQLSNQFYAGDLEAAFGAAQELQFDAGEISGFELELQQTVQARVAATYREVAALGDLDEPADTGLAAALTPVLVPAPAPEVAPGEDGITLAPPESKPVPSIGKRVQELRVRDTGTKSTWRLIYRVDSDLIVIFDWFAKKSQKTSRKDIERSKVRIAEYDRL